MTDVTAEAGRSSFDNAEKEFEQLYSDLNAARAAFFDPNPGLSEEALGGRGARYFQHGKGFHGDPCPVNVGSG